MIEPLALPEIDEAPPAGPNLENDPAFREMTQAAKGKADTQFDQATPPDWKEAAAQAMDLLARTRDLRVLVTLSIARLNLGELPVFASTLVTIRQLIETMWDDVHPRLDPDDDNDPIMRSNALTDLSNGKVVRAMRDAPLARTRTQVVAWVDVAVAMGIMEAEEGREKLTEAAVRGTFADSDKARLAATQEALQTIVKELAAIPKAFDEKAGAGQGPDFKDLPKLAYNILTEVSRHVQPDDAAAAEPEGIGDDTGGEAAPASAAVAAPRGGGRNYASIRAIASVETREEAMHALMLASTYFRTHEPSSPVPLLIDRGTRLAQMPFLDILRDLAPDGLVQARVVTGDTDEKE